MVVNPNEYVIPLPANMTLEKIKEIAEYHLQIFNIPIISSEIWKEGIVAIKGKGTFKDARKIKFEFYARIYEPNLKLKLDNNFNIKNITTIPEPRDNPETENDCAIFLRFWDTLLQEMGEPGRKDLGIPRAVSLEQKSPSDTKAKASSNVLVKSPPIIPPAKPSPPAPAKSPPIVPPVKPSPPAPAKSPPIVPPVKPSPPAPAKSPPIVPPVKPSPPAPAKSPPIVPPVKPSPPAPVKSPPIVPPVKPSPPALAKSPPIVPPAKPSPFTPAKKPPVVPSIQTTTNIGTKKPPIIPKMEPLDLEEEPSVKFEESALLDLEEKPSKQFEEPSSKKTEEWPEINFEPPPSLNFEEPPQLDSEAPPSLSIETPPSIDSEEAPSLKFEAPPPIEIEETPLMNNEESNKPSLNVKWAKATLQGVPKMAPNKTVSEKIPNIHPEVTPKPSVKPAPKFTSASTSVVPVRAAPAIPAKKIELTPLIEEKPKGMMRLKQCFYCKSTDVVGKCKKCHMYVCKTHAVGEFENENNVLCYNCAQFAGNSKE